MLHEKESEFARVGLEMGLLDKDQIDEAVRIKETMVSMGVKPKDIATILREKDYLSEEGFKTVLARVKSPAGRKVAGFEVIERLSQGAMGIVYKARQVSMDRVVALKVLSKDLKRKPHHVERFLREARAVAKLTHKNIVAGIDAGIDGDIYYFAMEFVEGEPLRSRIHAQGQLPVQEALEITLQTAEALEAAHGAGILHRDIKPDNIMMTRDGVAKLCDLGLAKVGESGETHLTQEGMSMGTPDYISPEQARGESDLDVRTDIYSLGITMFHMITGRTPFDGDNAMVVMTKHLTDPMPSLADFGADVSDDVEGILKRMTAKDREQRYATPTELRRDLETVLGGGTLGYGRGGKRRAGTPARSGVRSRPARRGGSNLGVALGVGAGLLLSVGAVVFFAGGDEGEPVDPGPTPPAQGTKGPGANDPGPGPGPDRPDPAAVEPDEKAFAELQDHARREPDDWLGIDSKASAFTDRYPASSRVPAARAIQADARQRAETKARDELAPIAAQADRLEREGKFWEAAGQLERFPHSLRFTDVWQKETRSRIDGLAARIATRFDEDKANAGDAADEGRFPDAYRILDGVAVYADPPRVEEARNIAESYRARASEAIDAERARFRQFVRKFVQGIAFDRWDWSEARRTHEGESFTVDPFRQQFLAFQKDLDLLDRLPAAAKSGLERRRGEDVVLGGVQYRIASVDLDRVTLSIGGGRGEVSQRFSALPADWFFNGVLLDGGTGLPEEEAYRILAMQQLWTSRKELVAGRLTQARRIGDLAEETLDRLSSKGHDVERWKGIAREVDGAIREAEARALYERVKREIDRARRDATKRTLWLQPRTGLGHLLSGRYSETDFVRMNKDEIDRLVADVDAQLAR